MRQRILRQLWRVGPATVTDLARESSGIMSHHLRRLAEHGFVREASDRGHGRERWSEARPARPGQLARV